MATRKAKRSGTKRSGKKSTRKMGKKMSKWTTFVAKIFKELKKKNSDAKLGDAMKEASRRKNEM